MTAVERLTSHGGSKYILCLANFLIFKFGLQGVCLFIKFLKLSLAYKGLMG